MTREEVTEYLERDTWTFAKTMKQYPHWYLVRNQMSPEKKSRWEQVVQYIRDHGEPEVFKPFRKTYVYLYLNGYKYWTMGAPLSETIIINRERLK